MSRADEDWFTDNKGSELVNGSVNETLNSVMSSALQENCQKTCFDSILLNKGDSKAEGYDIYDATAETEDGYVYATLRVYGDGSWSVSQD